MPGSGPSLLSRAQRWAMKDAALTNASITLDLHNSHYMITSSLPRERGTLFFWSSLSSSFDSVYSINLSSLTIVFPAAARAFPVHLSLLSLRFFFLLSVSCSSLGAAPLLALGEPNRAQPRPSPDKGCGDCRSKLVALRPYLNTIPLPSSHLTRPITTTSLAGNPGNNHILSTAGFQSSFSCPGAANFVFSVLFFLFFFFSFNILCNTSLPGRSYRQPIPPHSPPSSQ